MTAALRTPELSDQERAFIRGENVKNAVATATPVEPAEPPPSQPDVSQPPPTKTATRSPLRVVPSMVNLSSRIPGELHERLMRASFDRKLAQQEPFTHQDIITEALSAWLKKAGYP